MKGTRKLKHTNTPRVNTYTYIRIHARTHTRIHADMQTRTHALTHSNARTHSHHSDAGLPIRRVYVLRLPYKPDALRNRGVHPHPKIRPVGPAGRPVLGVVQLLSPQACPA